MSRVLRPAAVVASVLAGGLALAACSALPGGDTAPSTSTVSPQPAPSGQTNLDRFYGQKLVWKKCGRNNCTKLTVPIDYAKPDGDTVQLAVLRVPAKSSSKRIGAMLVNPGGPGGSAVSYALAADIIVGKPVRAAYDIVGMDPRGVGLSDPITCMSDSELDKFLASDPTPDDKAEEQVFAQNAATLGSACAAKDNPLLGHVSTVEAAKDMDVLRAALGETKLNYLGKSYGTLLGATYAGLFPKQVGRFVLDGVVPPELTNEEVNLGQAEGFERATRAWATDCVRRSDCPLGSTPDEVMQGLRDLLVALDRSPLTKTGDPSVPELTEGWGSVGVLYAMYDKASWPGLKDALRAAVDKQDGSGLMELANSYAERDKGGGYSNNIMQAYYAVTCLDRAEPPSLAEHERAADAAAKTAPTWGRPLAWGSLPCATWPGGATGSAHKITAEGSGLIVVVGTTRDPATPYEWSVKLNDELANSTLVTLDSDGHTGYVQSTPNACVDNAIDAYYVKGKAPPKDLKC